MVQVLPERLPWFVAGPLIGLLSVALYAIANRHMGVSSSYKHVVTFVRDRSQAKQWRVWWFGGLVVGSLVAAFLRGGPSPTLGYGALGLVLPVVVLIPTLFVAGLLMGYGARWAGGCTSGHGITGTSARSPASFVAVGTFMATAVGVTLLLHALTGGLL
ncbi:MAG: YeeE/YedE family protein [Chloroflexi bacterium]|nr:YeeE/YedE family protein [Chloroflexota bacterium]